jgi:Family of unknown function (DUF5752)
MNNLTAAPIHPAKADPSPFHFNSAAYLVQIDREKAANLGELLEALHNCSEDSIFQHTFRTLQEHHFIREGYSNDFAHWAHIARHEQGLAKKLADVDIRSFTSIGDLRAHIVQMVEEYLRREPASRDRAALKPFCFCSSETVVMPTSFVAHSLREFATAMEQVSVHSIHYHFIEARLRLKFRTNDFSQWLDQELGMKQEASQLNALDIYTSNLEEIRGQIVAILRSAVN